jgi:hypothetical protein
LDCSFVFFSTKQTLVEKPILKIRGRGGGKSEKRLVLSKCTVVAKGRCIGRSFVDIPGGRKTTSKWLQ